MMITINSYLHRELLKDIIRRWMYDDLQDSDAETITRLVHFNGLYVSRYLQCLSDKLFRALHQRELLKKQIYVKGDLKDAIVRYPPHWTPRIKELMDQYENHPGRFFRETPCAATLFFVECQGRLLYVGSSRIKRVRRLAEKGARRLIDGIFMTIKRHADQLADERAKQIGVPREGLITTPEEMLSEFLQAEERLLEDLRLRLPMDGIKGRDIDDVAGIKVILENEEQGRLIKTLGDMGDCAVVDEEHHTGQYNATNLIVRYRPPKNEILRQPLDHKLLSIMKGRGRTPEEVHRDFAEFVNTGEEHVHLEIIVSGYEEMLESEIGRSMHEDRIIEQRVLQQYRGHLAKNIEYLMRYLFVFPFSAQPRLEALPIKIWDRYLPEYFDAVVADLFQVKNYGVLEYMIEMPPDPVVR